MIGFFHLFGFQFFWMIRVIVNSTHKWVISFKQCKSVFGQRHCQRFPETGACAKTGTTPAIQPASYSTNIIAISIPLFLKKTEVFGLCSDTNHYICMFLCCILNELNHFAICNDDLLLPDNNPILFPALHCYLQKLLRFNIKVFWFLLFL